MDFASVIHLFVVHSKRHYMSAQTQLTLGDHGLIKVINFCHLLLSLGGSVKSMWNR